MLDRNRSTPDLGSPVEFLYPPYSMRSMSTLFAWIAVGAVTGGVAGFLVHPGPQYIDPVRNQVLRSSAFGAMAAGITLATLYVGVRMDAIPTA